MAETQEPPLAGSARARRSLATARAFQEGMNSLMQSMRSKPPRNPRGAGGRKTPLSQANSGGKEARERRIVQLEIANAKLLEMNVKYKRQSGRFSVKRRIAEKQKEALEERLEGVKKEAEAREDAYANLVEEIKSLAVRAKAVPGGSAENQAEIVKDMERIVYVGKEQQQRMKEWDVEEEKKYMNKRAEGRIWRSGESTPLLASEANSDDVGSVYSAASTVVDKKTIAELVALLEARLPKSHPAVKRAKDAVSRPTEQTYVAEMEKELKSLRKDLEKSRSIIAKVIRERNAERRLTRARLSDRQDGPETEAVRKVTEWRMDVQKQGINGGARGGDENRAESVGLSPQLFPPDPEEMSPGGSVKSMPAATLFKTPSVSSLASDGLGMLTRTYEVDRARRLFIDLKRPNGSRGLTGLL